MKKTVKFDDKDNIHEFEIHTPYDLAAKPTPVQTSAHTLSAPSHRTHTPSSTTLPSSSMKPIPPAQSEETKEVSSQDINLQDLFKAKSVTDNTDTIAATQQDQ